MNSNEAPFPDDLADLVAELSYKDGWTITLEDRDRGQGSQGLTLCILIRTPDSYHKDRIRQVMHYMPVPPASYNRKSWQRWLLNQILLVEQHEACEFFVVGDLHPYAPHHGPGNDPYTVFDMGTSEEAATSFLGQVNP